MTRFALDTQLLIDAIRDERDGAALRAYSARAISVTWLSAVVAQELLTGARPRAAGRAEEDLIAPLLARGQIFAPSFAAWRQSGEIIQRLHARRRIDRASVSKSFANDTLLAASCAEEEITLVTRNTRDFALIAEEIPFRFVAPWP